MTVGAINPLHLQVEYSLSEVNAGSTTLLKVSETSQYYLHDGSSEISTNVQSAIMGIAAGGTPSTPSSINVMDINLSGNLMLAEQVEAVIDTIEQLVATELNMAGVTNTSYISDFQASVEAVLQSNWEDLPTLEDDGSPIPSLNPDLFAMRDRLL